MAADKEIPVKLSMDPFQEIDKKKLLLMYDREVGLKKAKRVDFATKFIVTTSKWDKKKLEAQARAIFRYDLSLFASQVWQDFAPIQKAKDANSKKKAVNAFLKAVPKLQKNMEKKLQEKLDEFQEDVASGAGDDLGELKATRKSLTAGHPEAMAKLMNEFFTEFEKSYKKMDKLKKTVLKSSGEKKEEATSELEDEVKSQVPELLKKLNNTNAVLKKRVGVMSGIPAAMKKSMKKDMSDAAKAEFQTSMDTLAKAVSVVESQVVKYGKGGLDVIQKFSRKDIGPSSYNLFVDVSSKLEHPVSVLDDTMNKVDAKLKKLEQTAKKR